MWFASNARYTEISTAQQGGRQTSLEEEFPFSSEDPNASLLEKNTFNEPSSKRSLVPRLSTALNIILLLASIVMFEKSLQWQIQADRMCLNMHSAYSPALKEIDPTYRPVQFNGTLDHPSIYRGDPSPMIDAAWNRLEDVRVMSITEEEVIKIGKTTDAIKIPSQFGGGYMASVEANHQLHCVNFLRKSLSPEYYAPPSPYASVEFTDEASMIVTHQRHCIEMLRQFVMCHADVGMITHRWVKHYPRPYPDFSTWHQCRNFENVLRWTQDKQLKEEEGGPPEGWTYVPADGESVLEMPP